MPELSAEKLAKMRESVDPRILKYLAKAASARRKVTYGELAAQFGGIARGYGNRLGGVTLWCHDRGLPKLPVLVVNKETGRPSLGAVLYKDLGLISADDIAAEQRKCFEMQWDEVKLD